MTQKIFYDQYSGNIVSINACIDNTAGMVELPLPDGWKNTVQNWKIDTATKTFVLKKDLAQLESDRMWGRIRGQRDALLTSTDWTQVPDNALTAQQRAAWAQYRQQLRDVTDLLPAVLPRGYSVQWPQRPI